MITFNDLCEQLKREDELSLLEILDISSDELVEMLESYISDNQDHIRHYYENSEGVGWEEESNQSN